MVVMNVFRLLADISHTTSKCILIWAIHSNRSAEGVSLITQALYVLVFCTRYLDLFWVSPLHSLWNFVLKNFYILSSLYIIALMMRVYARTRERERAWRLGATCLGGATIAAPFVTLIFRKWEYTTFEEVLWTFSIILESVCVLPQLILLRQTSVPTVIDSFYLLTLGSYRAFYILNWILRAAIEHSFEPIALIFGIVQTAFYIDFAWVYWTRQRVKLRGGGVVDSDDLSRGWLLTWLTRNQQGSIDEEEGPGAVRGADGNRVVAGGGKWGARGISVSADENLHPQQQKSSKPTAGKGLQPGDDEAEGILEDDSDDGLHGPASLSTTRSSGSGNEIVNGQRTLPK